MAIDFDSLTLAVLGVLSLRQIFAQNTDIPIPAPWRYIFYDKKSDSQPVLCRRRHELNKAMAEGYDGQEPIDVWLGIAARNIKFYPGGLTHGSANKRIESKYFIDTLAASYKDRDLDAMVFIIRKLIQSKMDEIGDIDFILCRKNGNTKLAERVHGVAGPETTLICYHDKRSGFPMYAHDAVEYLNSDYENIDRLREAADERDSSYKLNGIVIDCSVSSADGLDTMIKKFNEMVGRNGLNINPVKHAFVMHTHKIFDDTSISFKLHRFVDMDEEIRRLICDASNKGTKEAYKQVKKYLKSQKLYHPI